jgi:putative protease
MEESVFLKKSTLNQLRRDAVEYLYEYGAVYYDRPTIGEIKSRDVFNFSNKRQKSSPAISLKINSIDEAYLIDPVKVKRVYIPYSLDLDMVKDIDGVEKYLWIPNIVHKSDYISFKKNIEKYEEAFDGVCVNNPGTFHFFKQKSRMKIQCGSTFNILNSFGAELLSEKGAEGFTFSVEANIRDIDSIMKNTAIKSEIVSHAYVQLMVMKNCPMSLIKKCRGLEDCAKCGYRERFMLKDRKGAHFNIERENRLTHIYNSVPLTLIGKMEDFVDLSNDFFFIDTKWEDNIEEVIDAIYCELNGVQTSNVLKENNFTRGHYLKNIL